MRLAIYLKDFEITDAQFAERCDVDKSTVGRWAAGTTMPRRRQLRKITVASEGNVTANDFAEDPDGAPPSVAANDFAEETDGVPPSEAAA